MLNSRRFRRSVVWYQSWTDGRQQRTSASIPMISVIRVNEGRQGDERMEHLFPIHRPDRRTSTIVIDIIDDVGDRGAAICCP